MKRILFQLFCLCVFANANAQLSTNELPVSFNAGLKLPSESRNDIPTVTMPKLDMIKIEAEDKEDELYNMPPRFGYRHKVDYNLKNSGVWKKLPNGDKLWQLNVVCPNALSVNFCYDKFWIPEGGKFFVYSKDRKHSIGAFTSRNNKGNRENLRGFATDLIYCNDVILEYYQPKNVTADAIISIEYVVHGYRDVFIDHEGYGKSGDCMVNVNCEEGQGWQNEKKAVARIVMEGCIYCTGSLINTTELNGKPLFLTADHCIRSFAKDAITDPYLDYTLFHWNYEVPGCANPIVEPIPCSTTGATVLANNDFSDFALLRLTEDPQNLPSYIPFYLGWDCSGQCGNPGVCIHHPKGDVKKISTVAQQEERIYGFNKPEWQVLWQETLNGYGMTQSGSSGSALINAMHRVIGQLNDSNTEDCHAFTGHSFYRRFEASWTGYNNNGNYRKLSCWLDSLNTGTQVLDGLLVINRDTIIAENQQLFCNIRIINNAQLTIQSNVKMEGNSCIIVEAGSELIINGGKLSNVEIDLIAGSSFQIINGGVLETRNNFVAPVGVTVSIPYGQIKKFVQ